ncbi:ABC transporter ATP-binding protein [Yimella sp. cx-51]|uniref:iron ABC transporter ATP-binding protein n=1 Tax=Yimella sp. cx-51 TaxID=2770551 RepID=UPI00165EB15F|nr:ATP-binding cassette domain-containing protein [Yimella sp. cx-51]MBC9955564.1 ATP-binding cassette domain-containing protein [Yimella sp. cx-51]QTH37859.1 ATP-binding cassette domain-containing protein [Yimella sp. cx-51]
MIVAEKVQASYDRTVVVDDVSIELPAGGVTCLIGPNGAGKSTLLSVVARLHSPDTGRVAVDGLDVHTTASDVIARRLAVLRQDNHLALRLTVRDLVSFGRFPYSKGRLNADDRAHVDHALERLDLVDLADRFLDELSGGQRQRAFVAMVIAQNTDYVLLDEPLNNLDMKHAASMMSMLRRAADELGRTVVVVVHDINAAAAYADNIVVMKSGRVVAQGDCSAIMRTDLLEDVFELPVQVHRINGVDVAVHYGL